MAKEETLDRETSLKIYESYPGEKQQNQSTTDPVKKNKKRKNKKKRKSKPNGEQEIKEDSISNPNLVQGEKPEEKFLQLSEKENEGQIPTANSDSLVADSISKTNLVQGEEPEEKYLQSSEKENEGQIPTANSDSLVADPISNTNLADPISNTNLVQGEELDKKYLQSSEKEHQGPIPTANSDSLVANSISNTNLVQGEEPEEKYLQSSEKEHEGLIPTANSDSLVADLISNTNLGDPISNTNLVQGEKSTAEGNIPCTYLESFSEGQIINSNISTKTDLPVQNINSSKDERQTSTKITGTRPESSILDSNLAQVAEVQITNTNSAQRDGRYLRNQNSLLKAEGTEELNVLAPWNVEKFSNTYGTKKYLYEGYKESTNIYSETWDHYRNPYRNASWDKRQNQYRNASCDARQNPYKNAFLDVRQNPWTNASLDSRQNPCTNASLGARQNPCTNASLDAKQNPCINASLDARQNPCTNASLDARQNPCTNASLDARPNSYINPSWDTRRNPSWDTRRNPSWDTRQNLRTDATTRNDLLFPNTNLASRYPNEDAVLWDGKQFTSKNSKSSDITFILNTNSTRRSEGKIFNANFEQGCGRPLRNQNSLLIAEGGITYANPNILHYRPISNPNIYVMPLNQIQWDVTANTNTNCQPEMDEVNAVWDANTIELTNIRNMEAFRNRDTAIYGERQISIERDREQNPYTNAIQGNTIRFQNSIPSLQEISNSYLVPMINEQILNTNIATRSQLPNPNFNTTATTNLQVLHTNSASWDGITDTTARTKLQVPQANRALWDVGDIPNSNLFLSELSEELGRTNNASWDVNQNPNTNTTAGADLFVPCTPWLEIDSELEINSESEMVGEYTNMRWSEGEPISRMDQCPIGQILNTNRTEIAAEQIANINSSQTDEQIQNSNVTEWSDFQGSTTNLTSRNGRENQNTNTPIRDGGQFPSTIMYQWTNKSILNTNRTTGVECANIISGQVEQPISNTNSSQTDRQLEENQEIIPLSRSVSENPKGASVDEEQSIGVINGLRFTDVQIKIFKQISKLQEEIRWEKFLKSNNALEYKL